VLVNVLIEVEVVGVGDMVVEAEEEEDSIVEGVVVVAAVAEEEVVEVDMGGADTRDIIRI